MKRSLYMTGLALAGMCSTATGITLNDAVYSATGSGVKESVLVENVAFNNSTFTFTVDSAALVGAVEKYDGDSILLAALDSGYISEGTHVDYYTLAWVVTFNSSTNQLTFLPGYIYNGAFKDVGNYTCGTSTIEKAEVVSLTIRGLSKDGGGSVGIRYAFEGQIANSGFANYMNWRNSEAEDFDGIYFEAITNNTEFVSSYYLFDRVTTAAERKELVNAAAEIAPSIPEPTTATLSLLALAGLAARRRRH